MRRLAVPLILIAAALPALAAPAAAQEPTIDLVMEDRFFRLAAGGDRNPALPVPAGGEVVVHVANLGQLEHNFHVGAPVGRETPCCQEPGETATLTFTLPAGAPAEIGYWCVLHRAQGMEGVLRVQASGSVPRVAIVRPDEGATVPTQFLVRAQVENATLGEGGARLRYLIDGAGGHPGWNTTSTTFVTPALPEGYHLVRVELVRADGAPHDPPVAAERMVFVSPAAPPDVVTPTDATGGGPDAPPGDDGTPGPGAGAALLALALAGAVAAARRRRDGDD